MKSEPIFWFTLGFVLKNGHMVYEESKKELILAIRTKIENRGLSVRMVADLTNLSKSQIHKIVSHEIPNVSLDNLFHIAELLSIPYSFQFKPKK